MKLHSDESLSNVRQWGFNTHSFLSLYPDVRHFRIDGLDGYVPYVESDNMILVAGDPITSEKDFSPLLKGFMQLSLDRKKKLALIPSRGKDKSKLEDMGFDAIFIGKEPIFDLRILPKPSKSIRQAVARVKHLGVKIVGYDETYFVKSRHFARSGKTLAKCQSCNSSFNCVH